ncbi:MAG: 3-phosphoshikimate 1-carboxyvinyltransferase [Aeropyrum sp.]|nr:3-phosphoshikimate 1-carboxyvinyltransferase [Aeropyrum sp.]
MLRIKAYPSMVDGAVKAPPSKSHTHRALFSSLLARGRSLVVNALISGDTKATLTAVKKLGAEVRVTGSDVEVSSPPTLWWPKSIYCRGSATTLRIAMAISSLAPGVTLLYGDPTLNRRPVKPLADALERLGARVITTDGKPPVAVSGVSQSCCRGEAVSVDASQSSQYVTALLMIAPLLGIGVKPLNLASRPYVDVTRRVLEGFGVKVSWDSEGRLWVEGSFRPSKYKVPGDYSSSSFLMVAGAIGGRVRVWGLDLDDPQGDKLIIEILKMAGAKVRVSSSGGWVEVEAGKLEPFEANLEDTPDLAPPVAVLASYARGESVLRGIGRLALKESDRRKAIASNLFRIGVDASISCGGDCIKIRGGKVEGGRVSGYGDHRIIMAFLVAGLGSRKGVEVVGASRYKDSYPGFVEDLQSLGARLEVVG